MAKKRRCIRPVLWIASGVLMTPGEAWTSSVPMLSGSRPQQLTPEKNCRVRAFVAPTSTSAEATTDYDDYDDDSFSLVDDLEVIQGDHMELDEEDWIPDAVKARQQPRQRRSQHWTPPPGNANTESPVEESSQSNKEERPSPYTEEEKALIGAMSEKAERREPGYLGDSTLDEISMDYSIPVCYLADVLFAWGVPAPINIDDRLGDLVNGEQAFALVEALYSIDSAYIHDMYSNQNLLEVCEGWDIDLKEAFEFSMKEGWSLPFGVQTNLRVGQESELIRVLAPSYIE